MTTVAITDDLYSVTSPASGAVDVIIIFTFFGEEIEKIAQSTGPDLLRRSHSRLEHAKSHPNRIRQIALCFSA
jgi:hypothetical protein